VPARLVLRRLDMRDLKGCLVGPTEVRMNAELVYDTGDEMKAEESVSLFVCIV